MILSSIGIHVIITNPKNNHQYTHITVCVLLLLKEVFQVLLSIQGDEEVQHLFILPDNRKGRSEQCLRKIQLKHIPVDLNSFFDYEISIRSLTSYVNLRGGVGYLLIFAYGEGSVK